MNQKEINLIYNITSVIHNHSWCKNQNTEIIQEWVSKQLSELNIFTIPCGASWGALVDKKNFITYWAQNGNKDLWYNLKD